MLIEIKLYGGLICHNQSLESCGLKKFKLEMPQGSTLEEVHKLLNLSTANNLVSIVNGHAQFPKHVLSEDCNISIFPPMADR
jgi:molybdopterin converting factor small subunit